MSKLLSSIKIVTWGTFPRNHFLTPLSKTKCGHYLLTKYPQVPLQTCWSSIGVAGEKSYNGWKSLTCLKIVAGIMEAMPCYNFRSIHETSKSLKE